MKKEEDIRVGQRIKNIRSTLKLDQKTFAKKIGATVSALSNWENGRNKPNDIKAKAIADLAGITVDELLHGQQDNELVQIYNKHSAEDYGKLFKYYRLIDGMTIEEQAQELSTPHFIGSVPKVTISVERLEQIEEGNIKPSLDELMRLFASNSNGTMMDMLNLRFIFKLNLNSVYDFLKNISFEEIDKNNVKKMVDTLNLAPVIRYDTFDLVNIYNYMVSENQFQGLDILKSYFRNTIENISEFLSDKEDGPSSQDMEMDLIITQGELARNLNKIEAYEEVYL
ncbi:helix-turn-helix transcriptional regulator [Aerococcus sp. UMB1112A]|uniref:helix-turn-helix domain-containing protein n=1 Tax=Aerococcus sp. UMB1112A TaxID=3050609 RepID=UPI00254F66C1|nr:helix-turn-helix transcriptional regulator [Aerococcus sp. UMB1112A]MDK8502124.1 helix-turn-helix transcriptional regulator [Aerococcus sp. UMB1112A]